MNFLLGPNAFFNSQISLDIVLKSLFTFAIFIIFRKYISKGIIKFLKNTVKKNNIKGVGIILDSIEEPLKTFFLFAGIYFALIIFPLNMQINDLLTKLFRCVVIISVARCFLKLGDSYEVFQEKFVKNKAIVNTLGPIVIKATKILIVIIALSAIGKEFGFKLDTLLAGLGIGGLAIAMAAQDMLKNFFGGFVIITDNTFNVGDIVKVDSNEGVVEEVGFRSTKIRTFEKELITVPNSKFSEGAVINYSRRGLRRVKFHVGATYATTADKLKNVVDKTKIMLNDNEYVDSESIIVKFDGFGGSSLDILVMYFILYPDYKKYMEIKENINFDIMKIFEEEGVEFAFPSMSVYLEKEEK